MSESKIPKTAMLVFLLSFSILPNSGLAKYSGGTGDVNDPYQIATVADLLALRADTNDYGKNFALTADIDLAAYTFTTAVIAPDGNNSNYEFDGIAFTGVFDGAGHKIINLTVDTDGAGNECLGLFGAIALGEVKNLGLENVSIASGNNSWCLGGLAGWNNGAISNCYSTGTVTSGSDSMCLGGLVGLNYWGTISNCFATGIVTSGNGSSFLGGLAGYNYFGTISNCFSTGTVTSGNDSLYLGGLVGGNDGTINSCYFLVGSGPDNELGTPLTDEQMKQQSSFLGWDFVGETANGTEDIWRMCIDGVNYPLLWWQFSTGDFVCPDGVNFADFAIMANAWLSNLADVNWNGRCNIAKPPDNVIDVRDLAVFRDNWLKSD